MNTLLRMQPGLLGKINERQILRVLQTQGPLSRAELARQSGLSAPTVSKAAVSLLQTGLIEEEEAPEPARGRPAKKLRLARQNAQVLGVVLDAEECQVISAGLDGKLHLDQISSFPTPDSYEQLLEVLVTQAGELLEKTGMTTLGIGISMPGLIDYRQQRGVLSPNVPLTNGRTPGLDLSRRLGVACVTLQESHALCLAERHYGLAQGLDDFAMMDVGSGVGLGVMSGGRLLTGHNGLAGEIGHITVVDNGRPCGCGNRGCLETVASDAALAWRVSKRLGKKVSMDRVIELARTRKICLDEELQETCRYLAVGLAAVINLFNPSTLFVHGRQFEADERLFPLLVEGTRQRALSPSFSECRIVQAKGSKHQGAVAGIIQHLTSAIAPALDLKDGLAVVRRTAVNGILNGGSANRR